MRVQPNNNSVNLTNQQAVSNNQILPIQHPNNGNDANLHPQSSHIGLKPHSSDMTNLCPSQHSYEPRPDQTEVNSNMRNFLKQDANNRQRLNSEANTALACWLCNEFQNQLNPFVTNCMCSGSNHIHALCLVKLVEEELKTKKRFRPSTFSRKSVNQHQCSICKHKFQSILQYKFNFKLHVDIKNIAFILVGLLCLIISVGMMVISYKVFIGQRKDSGGLYEIYLGFVIFLGVLCIIVFLSFLVLALFMFYKAFVKLIIDNLLLVSNIKDKELLFPYDLKINSYFFYQGDAFNTSPTKCHNSASPQLRMIKQNPTPNEMNHINMSHFNNQYGSGSEERRGSQLQIQNQGNGQPDQNNQYALEDINRREETHQHNDDYGFVREIQ